MPDKFFHELKGNYWGQFIALNVIVFFVGIFLSKTQIPVAGYILAFFAVLGNFWLGWKMSLKTGKGFFAALWGFLSLFGFLFIGYISPIRSFMALPLVYDAYKNMDAF